MFGCRDLTENSGNVIVSSEYPPFAVWMCRELEMVSRHDSARFVGQLGGPLGVTNTELHTSESNRTDAPFLDSTPNLTPWLCSTAFQIIFPVAHGLLGSSNFTLASDTPFLPLSCRL